jgi:hypothetical protein
LDGASDFFDSDGLQQARDLDIFAAGVLGEARFQQPPQ